MISAVYQDGQADPSRLNGNGHGAHAHAPLLRGVDPIVVRLAEEPAAAPAARLSRAHLCIEDELLGAADFLAVVRREQRRADRSHSPLTLMSFQLDATHATPLRKMRELQERLLETKRETDYLGDIDATVCTVLFPNTDEAGTRRFEKKILENCGDLIVSTMTATHPSEKFESITGENGLLASRSEVYAAHETAETYEYASKRTLDIVGAIVSLVLLAPLMLVTALAIKLTSPGPVIFRQTRLGKGGKPFVFYKFRSMTVGADDTAHQNFVSQLIKGGIAAGSQGAQGAPYKLQSDARVTRVGRLLRKTSIDEIPQLINVLKGDMSLVGPRPPIPYEAQNYQSWHYRRVLEMQPGITGLWQVEGRSRVPFDEMVRMDLRYMRRCSLSFDLAILLRTVKVVLRCEGAA